MVKNKRKIYVDYPSYIKTSNGTKCLYELIEYLETNNFSVTKIRRKSTLLSKIKDNLNIFSSEKLDLLFKDFNLKDDWFLACDTTPSNLLEYIRKNAFKVIWWQLAPYQFLGSSKLPKTGEYNYLFLPSAILTPKSSFITNPKLIVFGNSIYINQIKF